jgi:ankyrin repeat protein
MPKHRTPMPAELKELIQLIRHGRLFEVQKWIQEGRPIRLPEVGHFIVSPIQAAIRTGFHSMAEVMLDQLSKEEDLNGLLNEAVQMGRLDLIELLHRFGANPKSISYETVAYTHNPLILRWFEDHDVDLETDHPLATAFQYKYRAVLGTYMRWKDRMPQLKRQANMALRFHAGEGNFKWVCLLLWAGADPRASVPRLDPRYPDEDEGTAMQDAVSRGRLEVVEKFKIDPAKDNLSQLLYESALSANQTIVEKLLALGADPTIEGTDSPVRRYMWSLLWSLGRAFSSNCDYRSIVDILCLMASKGAKWYPSDDGDGYRGFRRALAKANPTDSIDALTKLVRAGFFTEAIFKELVSTPRMKELLNSGLSGVVQLRQFAGFDGPKRRRKRRLQA